MPTRAPIHTPYSKHTQQQVQAMRAREEQQRQAQRENRHQRGYTNRWARASKQYLAEHPFCEEHLKRDLVRRSRVTDHRIPHRGNMALFWDESNWQALCKVCHDRKTATEDGGLGHRFVQRGTIGKGRT